MPAAVKDAAENRYGYESAVRKVEVAGQLEGFTLRPGIQRAGFGKREKIGLAPKEDGLAALRGGVGACGRDAEENRLKGGEEHQRGKQSRKEFILHLFRLRS